MPARDRSPGIGHESSTVAAGRLRMGALVVARDGECGELARVVVDPVAQTLTDLVVAPKHHPGLGRLVPVELVEAVESDQIHLRCSTARFHEFEDAEEIRFLAADADALGYGSPALMWPYYGLGTPPSGDITQSSPTECRSVRCRCIAGPGARPRWLDRFGPGSGDRSHGPSRDARAAPGGPSVGAQAGGNPDRRRLARARGDTG